MPTNRDKYVVCPGCGGVQEKRIAGSSLYWCEKCQCQFDDDPDEGGDYADNPTRRIERQEEHKLRRQQRRSR